ncbi:MAG: hypothetical protein LIO69_06440 [Oscillospiraceae bacterium]|nr:hypothetical protein [Oscillospiraceae bacterium]
MRKNIGRLLAAAALIFLSACDNNVNEPIETDALSTETAAVTTASEFSEASASRTVAAVSEVEEQTTVTSADLTESVHDTYQTQYTESVVSAESTETFTEASESEQFQEIVSEVQDIPTEALTEAEVSVSTAMQAMVETDISADEETTALSAAETAAVRDENFHVGTSDLLEDGRVSAYTGKTVISHPYSYYQLTIEQQQLYDRLAAAMLDYEESVTFDDSDGVTFDDIHSVYQTIYNDEYRLYYISPTIQYSQYASGNIFVMKFDYDFSFFTVQTMNMELEERMNDILSQLNSSMSDYEIVKFIHDTVIQSCTYSSDNKRMNTVYGCLVDEKALCQGYARSFTYLCSEAGINSLVVLGYANESHMWNMVEMDGEWYHIDLTWDDPDRVANPDSVRYDYFGLTDERIRQLRTVEDYDYSVPTANGTKYQYYSYNGLIADSYDSAVAVITDEVLKAAAVNDSTVQFQCTDLDSFNDITQRLFSDSSENIVALLRAVLLYAENSFVIDTVVHNNNSDTYVIRIYLDYQV